MRERIEPVGIPSVHGGEDVKRGSVPPRFASQPSRAAKKESAVDFPAVADAKNEQPIVFNLADQSVISHAVFPELVEL